MKFVSLTPEEFENSHPNIFSLYTISNTLG